MEGPSPPGGAAGPRLQLMQLLCALCASRSHAPKSARTRP
jgi:hypothetical protein